MQKSLTASPAPSFSGSAIRIPLRLSESSCIPWHPNSKARPNKRSRANPAPSPSHSHPAGQGKPFLQKYNSELERAQRLMCPLDKKAGKRGKILLKIEYINHSTNYTPIHPSGRKVPCLVPCSVYLGLSLFRERTDCSS